MRIIAITLLVFLSCVSFYSQDKKGDTETKPEIDLNFNDGCGNPFVESQTYGYRRGKVVKITSSNKLIVEVWNSNNVWDDEHEESGDESKLIKSQMFEVSLVGINEATNKKAITDFLKEKLLNKQVTIVGNTRKKNSNKIQALVQFTKDDKFEEISEYLLENGITKFKDFELTNLIPRRTSCELERAETNAKKAKLGIWAK